MLGSRRDDVDHLEREFDAFYRGTAHRVVHLVYASTGDLTLAQDCTQEAYSRAWQQWSTVRTHDEPLSWVRTVARRLAISAWRKKGAQERAYRRVGVHDTIGPPTEDRRVGVHDTIGPPTEDRALVIAALRTLSDPVRETVTLHYIGDLSIEQIARETNTPAGTIKARLHRGRAQLADALTRPHETSGKETRHG